MLYRHSYRYPVVNLFRTCSPRMAAATLSQGDLHKANVNGEHRRRSLAIPESDDDTDTRGQYRPFILDRKATVTDWVEDLELDRVTDIAAADFERTGQRLKILVLFGSLRQRFAVSFLLRACFCVDAVPVKMFSHLWDWSIGRTHA